jgi:predicted nucleic acid-binding protein
MSRVFWDTNIFIYFFEDYGRQGKSARSLRERMLRRGDQLITSAMTVGEILVKPRQLRDLELCNQYERAITATALVVPFRPQRCKKVFSAASQSVTARTGCYSVVMCRCGGHPLVRYQ